MNDKIKILFKLGEVAHRDDWPDYLSHGFNETDIDALLALLTDEDLNQADNESDEIWTPLHAWRTLGQIGSLQAVAPLLALFDQFVEDDWAIAELPKVMGIIGEPAIPALTTFIHEASHDEFARVMAVDSLGDIAALQPQHRNSVVHILRGYINTPDESTPTLNALTVSQLIDLDAEEAIDDIRQLYEKCCVDITCNGDLEEVELAMGLRAKRSTPKPNFYKLDERQRKARQKKPVNGDIFEDLDYYLAVYGNDKSIQDVSELDGFFAALACAPDMIPPSHWLAEVWGGEAFTPEWETQNEFENFFRAALTLYNQVMQHMGDDIFEALFHTRSVGDETITIVDEWCYGFLRGVDLWGPLPTPDTATMEDCLKNIRLFTTDAGFDQVKGMSYEEIETHQQQIELDARRLFRYFLAQRKHSVNPVVRAAPKIGRNDPCSCGSGKKYKKCCLH